MCFVRGPAPNRSAKEFAVELSLCISTLIGVPRSMYMDLKDSPNSSSEEWIKISQCDCQSEPPRAFSRDWIASEIAVHESCDFVNVFFSSKSQCSFGFPTRYRAARFSGRKSNARGSLILWAKCLAVSAKSDRSWESLMHADLYRASSLFKIGLFLPSNTNFSRGVLTVLVFALHPDSLMMSGACFKSSSMSKYSQN